MSLIKYEVSQGFTPHVPSYAEFGGYGQRHTDYGDTIRIPLGSNAYWDVLPEEAETLAHDIRIAWTRRKKDNWNEDIYQKRRARLLAWLAAEAQWEIDFKQAEQDARAERTRSYVPKKPFTFQDS